MTHYTSGVVQWAANGVAISTCTFDQIFPAAVSDGNSGAILAWQDYRVAYPDSVDIYAQRVLASGTLGDESDVDTGGHSIPAIFELHQNYPNPFNPVTTIEYSIPSRANVTIEIFNVLGQKVRTLVNETMSAGSYRVEWTGTDDAGGSVSTGVYPYRF